MRRIALPSENPAISTEEEDGLSVTGLTKSKTIDYFAEATNVERQFSRRFDTRGERSTTERIEHILAEAIPKEDKLAYADCIRQLCLTHNELDELEDVLAKRFGNASLHNQGYFTLFVAKIFVGHMVRRDLADLIEEHAFEDRDDGLADTLCNLHLTLGEIDELNGILNGIDAASLCDTDHYSIVHTAAEKSGEDTEIDMDVEDSESCSFEKLRLKSVEALTRAQLYSISTQVLLPIAVVVSDGKLVFPSLFALALANVNLHREQKRFNEAFVEVQNHNKIRSIDMRKNIAADEEMTTIERDAP